MTRPDRTTFYAAALLAVYRRASRADRRAGRHWYGAARADLYTVARRYGVSVKRAAYAAAALSNNLAWEPNIELTAHVAYCAREGLQPRGHYGACLRKALAILAHGKYDALSGPKVIPFARALNGDTRAAVVDRWVWRAACPSADVRKLTPKRQRECGAALVRAARRVRVSVAVFQAIVWVTIRREAGEE